MEKRCPSDNTPLVQVPVPNTDLWLCSYELPHLWNWGGGTYLVGVPQSEAIKMATEVIRLRDIADGGVRFVEAIIGSSGKGGSDV